MKTLFLNTALLSTLFLAGCAGPITPFGGLHPWNVQSIGESEDIPDGLKEGPVNAEAEWKQKIAHQDNTHPWVLMDPEQINYVAPVTLKVYIHDPGNKGRRPRMRMTYDDWNLTSKIKDKKNWQKISETDWLFTSNQIKFSPARVGQLKVSFYSRLASSWVSNKLIEPQCPMSVAEAELPIRHTGRFNAESELIKHITNLSAAKKINPNLIAGLIAQESGFNSRAVSASKALGLTQVTPVAEKEILNIHPEFPQYPGLNQYSLMRITALVKMQEIGPNEEWRLDPEQSISGGITYLEVIQNYWKRFSANQKQLRSPSSYAQHSKLLEQEKLGLILASYNSGPARVKNAFLRDPKMWLKDDNLTEARTYVHKISSYCAGFSKTPPQKKEEK